MAAPPDRLSVTAPDAVLAAERWGRHGPVVILLHEGVADRRSWQAVGSP